MTNTKQLKLVKYRGYEDLHYVWFFVNSDDVKISEEFQSEIDALDWLDYLSALKRIEMLMENKPDTQKGEELSKLVTLVKKYELKYGKKRTIF